MDFAAIAKIGVAHSEQICRELFPLGTKRGKEFVVGDIYGNKGDSLSVSLSEGIWKDFASGRGGQDLTALIADARQIPMSEAAQYIEEKYGRMMPAKKHKKTDDDFTPIFPSPEIDEAAFTHPSQGEPSSIYQYLDRDGKQLNFVCRFDKGKKKSFFPLTYGILDGITGWHWKQLPAPRSLYRLDTLPESGTIILTEGEKAAEALAERVGVDHHVITWPGGSNAIGSVDWEPLFNKEYTILLWPDHDEPGLEAMRQIAYILHGKVEAINMLDVSGMPHKADAADFPGTDYELKAFLNEKWKRWKPAPPPEPKYDFDPNSNIDKINPLQFPGLVGDTVRWISKYSRKDQPLAALLNTIAFAGAVFGRKYASPINTRTNIYTVSVGHTAAGKDFSRKMITMLSAYSGLERFLGGNAVRSDTGMIKGLSAHSSQILMLDELGIMLKAISNPKAPYHVQMVMSALIRLYSDSNSVYHHGDYADQKIAPFIIHNPNLCIYGTTTEVSYIPALHKSAIESGELNRFIVLPLSKDRPLRKNEVMFPVVDDDLADKWKIHSKDKTLGAILNNAGGAPHIHVVPWGDCEKLQADIETEQDDMLYGNEPLRPLWGRFFENTIKIAMILAVGRNATKPVFVSDDFEVAAGLVRSSIKYMMSLTENHMSETAHESLVHEIMNYMRQHPVGVTSSELCKKFQKIKKRERDELIAGLLDQEAIEKTTQSGKEDGGGRPKITYRLLSKDK